MEVASKRMPVAYLRPGPQLMAVWPTSPPHSAYMVYVFQPEAWARCDTDRLSGWVEAVVEMQTAHLRKLGVDLNTVVWEMQHPLDWSEG